MTIKPLLSHNCFKHGNWKSDYSLKKMFSSELGSSGPLYVSLSFDDGHLSNYKMGKLLASVGVKATFFITTDFNGPGFLPHDPKTILELSYLGHEIGSHTCSHPNFLLIQQPEREQELRKSKIWLEQLLGRAVDSFAYPYYVYNQQSLQDTHKYYTVSRSKQVHVGAGKVKTFKVHFVTRRNVLTLLMNTLFRGKIDFAVLTLHNLSMLQMALLFSTLKIINASFPNRIKFVTISELAALVVK
jgi:peptidoglycan/xylan/chitin deacetylase (PgdA/CDA1 family)